MIIEPQSDEIINDKLTYDGVRENITIFSMWGMKRVDQQNVKVSVDAVLGIATI
jgi:hypothetical protein